MISPRVQTLPHRESEEWKTKPAPDTMHIYIYICICMYIPCSKRPASSINWVFRNKILKKHQTLFDNFRQNCFVLKKTQLFEKHVENILFVQPYFWDPFWASFCLWLAKGRFGATSLFKSAQIYTYGYKHTHKSIRIKVE